MLPNHASPSRSQVGTMLRALTWTCLALLTVLSIVDVFRGTWDHDSGYFLFRASLIAEGWRPYLDFTSVYPPLMNVLSAIPMVIGFDRLALAFAIPIAWILLNTAASITLARAVGLGWAESSAAGAGFLLLSIENEGNHVTLEHGVVFFSLVALHALVRKGQISPHATFLSGLAITCAVLIKQNGAVAILPVSALLWERRKEIDRKSASSFTAGVALPIILTLTWLSFRLTEIYEQVVGLLVTYAEKSPPSNFSLQSEFFRSAPTTFFLVVTPVLGALAIISGPRRVVLSASLVAAAIELSPRLLRNYPHYTLNVWPFALLVILIATRSRSDALRRIVRGTSLVIVATSSLAMFSPQSLERWEEPSYLTTVFAPAAESVRASLPPDGRLRMYAGEPIVPYLADRLPEEIDTPASAVSGIWDGSHLADEPLPRDVDVAVVVDRGGDWIPGVRKRLADAQFRETFDREHGFEIRVTVYRRFTGAAP